MAGKPEHEIDQAQKLMKETEEKKGKKGESKTAQRVMGIVLVLFLGLILFAFLRACMTK